MCYVNLAILIISLSEKSRSGTLVKKCTYGDARNVYTCACTKVVQCGVVLVRARQTVQHGVQYRTDISV